MVSHIVHAWFSLAIYICYWSVPHLLTASLNWEVSHKYMAMNDPIMITVQKQLIAFGYNIGMVTVYMLLYADPTKCIYLYDCNAYTEYLAIIAVYLFQPFISFWFHWYFVIRSLKHQNMLNVGLVIIAKDTFQTRF